MPGSNRAFDFDDWSALARTDPAGFETRRDTLLREYIDAQRPDRQERLKRLQWRLDRERERCKTPLGACVRFSNMMWESFAGEDGLADSLNAFCDGGAPRPVAPTAASILPFRRRPQ